MVGRHLCDRRHHRHHSTRIASLHRTTGRLGEGEVRINVTPKRRGYLRLTGITIARPDPFNLFKSYAQLPVHDSVLILPKRYEIPPIQLPGTRKFKLGGVSLASSVGESEEFISLRDYRPGDPLRHWRARRPVDPC